MVTAKDAKGLKYKMSEEFTVEAFETFVTALKAGELEPFLKSGTYVETSCEALFRIHFRGSGSESDYFAE